MRSGLASVTPAERPRGPLACIVLAAGEGRRFGAPKQVALLKGRPLLEYALEATSAWPCEQTVLVLGANAAAVEPEVDTGSATVVRCADWKRGQGASLRAGVTAVRAGTVAAVVTLGDEPFLPPEAGARLLAARRPGVSAIRACYHGRPGHPVIIERELFAAFQVADPPASPAATLWDAGLETIECGDLGDPQDIDTPEQLSQLGD